MNVLIYLLDVRDVDITSLLNSPYIFEDDRVTFSTYKNESTKKEKIASLILKRKYVGDYQIDENGKPVSEKVFFNVSHSHQVVVLVVDTVPIGIDIEMVRPIKDNLVNYVCSDKEIEYVRDEKSFYEIWTNKEALAKALGTGIKTKPNKIHGLPINGIRKYEGNKYFNKTVSFDNFVLTVSRCGANKYSLEIVIETI